MVKTKNMVIGLLISLILISNVFAVNLDVNRDGKISIADTVKVNIIGKQIEKDNRSATQEELELADFTGDGSIDFNDVKKITKLMRVSTGVPEYKIGTYWLSERYNGMQKSLDYVSDIRDLDGIPVYEITSLLGEKSKAYVTRDNLKVLDILLAGDKKVSWGVDLVNFPLYVGKKWKSTWKYQEFPDSPVQYFDFSFEVVDYVDYDYEKVVKKAFKIKISTVGYESYYHYTPPYGNFPGSNIADVWEEFESKQPFKLVEYGILDLPFEDDDNDGIPNELEKYFENKDDTGGNNQDYYLSEYPNMFIEDGNFNGLLVVGSKSPASDSIAQSIIISDLQTRIFPVQIPSTVGVLDTDVNNIHQNLILFGMPSENSLIKDLFSLEDKDFEKDTGIIKLKEMDGYNYLLIGGDAISVRNGAEALSGGKLKDYKINEVFVVSNGLHDYILYRK